MIVRSCPASDSARLVAGIQWAIVLTALWTIVKSDANSGFTPAS